MHKNHESCDQVAKNKWISQRVILDGHGHMDGHFVQKEHFLVGQSLHNFHM